jgi:hypothetical protein
LRKRLITPIPQDALPLDDGWLDLDDAAVVEVTSEENGYPVESALVSGAMRGWRAADSGSQTIRLIFDEPQTLTLISLVFEETETERTQEFVLRWSPDGGRSFREIVRQQWNFRPVLRQNAIPARVPFKSAIFKKDETEGALKRYTGRIECNNATLG